MALLMQLSDFSYLRHGLISMLCVALRRVHTPRHRSTKSFVLVQ